MISVFDKKEDCCGCTACKNICPTNAIVMVSDQEGFLYPYINQELCIDCGKCRKVCPFQNIINVDDKLDESLIYAIKHKNLETRMESTSGGVYTAISNYTLDKSGTVYGAKFDDNFHVVHSRAVNLKERNEFRGSKYVQSDLKDVFDQIQHELRTGQNVLFTGTGCQVAGLRKFITDTRTNIDRLVTNDIVCHGTPSPLLWDDYLKFIQKNNILKSYTFRHKEKGWHGYNVKAEYENGKCKINTTELKGYANLFSSNLTLRPSCYNCKFANLDRTSDIMMGDFWGIEKTMPELDDDKGISLVLINTHKGKIIFDEIKENLEVWECNIQDCLQPNLIKPTKRPEKREQFWQEYYDNGFKHIAKKYGGYNLKSIVKKNIKALLKSIGLLKYVKR
jgi:coenzyme F420-reducing hydrogenase beta subunit